MAVRDAGAVQRLPGPARFLAESGPGLIGPITLDAKHAGKRSAGDPHAPFDVAGAGNVTMAAGPASAKTLEHPPAPEVGAPVLDPTDELDVETEQWSGYLGTANRKGRQQRSSIYSHRATSRLYLFCLQGLLQRVKTALFARASFS